MDTQAGCSVELANRCVMLRPNNLGGTGLKLLDSVSINAGGFDQGSNEMLKKAVNLNVSL